MKTKEQFNSSDLADTILHVTGNDTPHTLHEPEFLEQDKVLVQQCLETGWVSTAGHFVQEFEQKICEFTGAKFAIAVTNGTSALHLSLLEAGAGAEDEILCPAVTFVATANAISYVGAIPHFVDSSLDTLGIDPEKLDSYLETITKSESGITINRISGKQIRFIMPVHTLGHPVEMDKLIEIAKKYNLTIIEDASEGLGSFYKGVHVGLFGRSGVLSFNGNKILTTGGGGAVLTNCSETARKIKHLSTTAKVSANPEFIHDEIGYNYRLPNLNAALGCAQIENLNSVLTRKRNLAGKYRLAFEDHRDFRFVDEPLNSQSNFWLNAIMCKSENEIELNKFIHELWEKDVYCRPIWKLMPKLQMYANCPKASLTNANLIENSLICLPSSAKLGAP